MILVLIVLVGTLYIHEKECKTKHLCFISFLEIVVFAWEAYEKGTDVHLQADPTKLELLHREYKVKKADFKKDLKGGVLEKVI